MRILVAAAVALVLLLAGYCLFGPKTAPEIEGGVEKLRAWITVHNAAVAEGRWRDQLLLYHPDERGSRVASLVFGGLGRTPEEGEEDRREAMRRICGQYRVTIPTDLDSLFEPPGDHDPSLGRVENEDAMAAAAIHAFRGVDVPALYAAALDSIDDTSSRSLRKGLRFPLRPELLTGAKVTVTGSQATALLRITQDARGQRIRARMQFARVGEKWFLRHWTIGPR